jgi:hypothetical protein
MPFSLSNPASMLFSPNDVKGMVGMVFVVIVAFYFKKQKNKTKSPIHFFVSTCPIYTQIQLIPKTGNQFQ